MAGKIPDFSSRNLERLELFKEVALKTNRQLIIAAKDAYLLYALEIADNIDHLKDLRVYERPMSRIPHWQKSILKEKKNTDYINSDDIKENPDGINYIKQNHQFIERKILEEILKIS
ncbi:MAG: hypothetical protein V3V33_16360 [Candidatus Lokiarchaeia archaeon]